MKVVLLAIYMLLFAAMPSVQAQEAVKKEREKSIAAAEFPASALSLLAPLMEEAKRVHYYLETDAESVSYEVKLKYEKQPYSIEFDEKGQLLDIEWLIDWSDLEPDLQASIKQTLAGKWEHSKVTRLQKQFRYRDGQPSELVDLPPSDTKSWSVFFELEVDAQAAVKEKLSAFELLFDSRGALISLRPIEKIAVDNLIY